MQFWHDLVSHSSCFGAVAVFTQIDFKLHRENFFAAHSFEGYYILVAAADNNRRRGEGGALLVKENDFFTIEGEKNSGLAHNFLQVDHRTLSR